MAAPLVYRSGEEIRPGDRVLFHGEPAQIEFVLDGEHNPDDWPAEDYGRGVMVAEPKVFGHAFLPEDTLATSEDLEFVSRTAGPA